MEGHCRHPRLESCLHDGVPKERQGSPRTIRQLTAVRAAAPRPRASAKICRDSGRAVELLVQEHDEELLFLGCDSPEISVDGREARRIIAWAELGHVPVIAELDSGERL